MNLELLIGPSGVGKTNYILNDIELNRDNHKIIDYNLIVGIITT